MQEDISDGNKRLNHALFFLGEKKRKRELYYSIDVASLRALTSLCELTAHTKEKKMPGRPVKHHKKKLQMYKEL